MFDTSLYHDPAKPKQSFAGVIISCGDSVLLGRKKRGFGTGTAPVENMELLKSRILPGRSVEPQFRWED